MKKELIIFGKSGTALEIVELIDMYYQEHFSNVSVVFFEEDFVEKNGLSEKVNHPDYELNFVLGMADIEVRKSCVAFVSQFTNFKPYTIINPTAFVAKSAVIGQGVYIAGNASVSSKVVLKDYTLVSFNSSIGHGSVLEEHVIILAGTRVSGDVEVGRETLIGSNAFIFQGLKIGEQNLIDALTYIRKDLAPKMISTSRKTQTFPRIDV